MYMSNIYNETLAILTYAIINSISVVIIKQNSYRDKHNAQDRVNKLCCVF